MDTLYASLGQFYFAEHDNSPPTLVQVVGWTQGAERPKAKRRYVYVRKVPLNVQQGIFGGQWDFDYQTISQYAQEITAPVQDSHHPLAKDNAIIIDGAQFLRFHSQTLQRYIFDSVPHPQLQPPPLLPPSPQPQPQPTIDDPMQLTEDDSDNDSGNDSDNDSGNELEYDLQTITERPPLTRLRKAGQV